MIATEAPRGRGRTVLVLASMLAGLLLAWGSRAFALDPALDVNQYAHTAWTVRDGHFKGSINAIAQAPEGYLLLGTEFGLLRFDGVRSVPWPQPKDDQLADVNVQSLLAARDGRIWMGTMTGLASWKDGKLTRYPELGGQYVLALLEDREGTVWAGTSATPNGKLCAIRPARVECYGQDGSFGVRVVSLFEDRKGTLWAGAMTGLWQWKPGPPRLYPLSRPAPQIHNLTADDAGALLVSVLKGVIRLVDGKTSEYPLRGVGEGFNPFSLLRDRDGGLWIGTRDRGLLHVRQGATDSFSQSDGLSGDHVNTIFEDREGNVWVGTVNGLDRFRDLIATTISVKQGLSNPDAGSVLAARDGSVWIGTRDGLNRWKDGQITIFHKRNSFPRAAAREGVRTVTDGGLPDDYVGSLLEDRLGRIWVFSFGGVAYLEQGRFTPVSAVPRGFIHSVAEDGSGGLWMSPDEGLVHWRRAGLVEQIPWARLGREDKAWALANDPRGGGLWLGFWQGGLTYVQGGQVRATYGAADGLGDGRVNSLRLDAEGTLWAATQGGLSRVRNGRAATLTSRNGLPCDAVDWVLEGEASALWLSMACGLVRIDRPELDAWVLDSRRTIRAKVLDASDGVRSHAFSGGSSPRAARSVDGKLWFLPLDGVSVIDPRHLPSNSLPPPVYIEQVIADRNPHEWLSDVNGRIRLPPHVRDLQIDYTALCLVASEKVLFRYKLEGWDRDWQDAGTRRHAFYSNLPPRSYRFRVIACNNSGVWNEAGASLDISIDPAYYQTAWFRVACGVALLAFLAALHKLRMRHVRQEVRVRMEGRLEERERIARDLHDTLLQGVQGLILKFAAVAKRMPSEEPARRVMEETLDRADHVLAEARDRVRNLRGAVEDHSDLRAAFDRIAEQASEDRGATFTSVVEGRPRGLDPAVVEEIYFIGREAIVNAFTHSGGSRVELEITCETRHFRLRIRDDGRGIDPGVLEGGPRSDHWGLQGMRERAGRIGAQLEFWSSPGAGTEVELRVPARIAFRGTGVKGRTSWLRRFTG